MEAVRICEFVFELTDAAFVATTEPIEVEALSMDASVFVCTTEAIDVEAVCMVPFSTAAIDVEAVFVLVLIEETALDI